MSEITSAFGAGLGRPGAIVGEGSWAASSVVADICLRAGIPFDRLNLQGVEGLCAGMPLSPADAAYTGIEALAQIYLFDPANYDGQLHFVPRGLAPVAELTLDDLVDEGKELKKLKRKDSITVPRVLHLEYYDLEGGLSADKQTSDRSLDNRAVAETKVETSVLMHADDAARAAVINHKIGIEEQRGGYEFGLPDNWSWLTVGDVITLDGERLRITEIEIDDGVQKYVTLFDRASAYQSAIQGVRPQTPIDPPTLIVGDTMLHFIDSPILRDSDDRLGYYVAVSGNSEAWRGALVELSVDGGENYTDAVDAMTDADMGALTQPLASHSRFYPDEHNTLTVQMLRPDMELEGSSLAGMMNRQNLALVGGELINFAEAQEIQPGMWELYYLLRGRKGSTIATHPAGTRFVMLDRQQLWFIDAEVFELGRTLTFRSTSFGSDQAATQQALFTGRSQTERAPSYLKSRRSGGNLTITWQGVGRLGGGSQVRQGAHFAGYQVIINGTSITTQNNYYIMAEPAASAAISVRQLNALTGPGAAAEITA